MGKRNKGSFCNMCQTVTPSHSSLFSREVFNEETEKFETKPEKKVFCMDCGAMKEE